MYLVNEPRLGSQPPTEFQVLPEGYKVLRYQANPEPEPGAGLAPTATILVKRPNKSYPYVVWRVNLEDRSCYLGDYFTTDLTAIERFNERTTR